MMFYIYNKNNIIDDRGKTGVNPRPLSDQQREQQVNTFWQSPRVESTKDKACSFKGKFFVLDKRWDHHAFSLSELVLVAGILAFTLVGLIRLYIYTSVEGQLAGNKTVAVSEAQDKLEEIRNHNYSLITIDYGSGGTPGNVFDLSQLGGKGIVYIDSSNSELLVIEVVVCWRDKYDRIIGSDLNLNGQWDSGEANESGKLISPVKLMTMITRR